MSDMYFARQPIFDRDMKIFGYKLLYHGNSVIFADNEDDDKSAASLIDNMLLVEFESLTEGGRGFVRFTKNLILREAPLLFPKKKTIIEIPGDIETGKSTENAVKKMKEQGHILALDDFDMDEPEKYLPFLEYVDIAKINFSPDTGQKQAHIIDRYRNKLIFLAKKVETRENFKRAKSIGYKLFQGAFYSKPVTLTTKRIGSFTNNLVFILNELYKETPDFDVITSAFERDVELSYKLLRMVNSAFYGMKYHTDSLHLALVQIGTKELRRWLNVMLLRGTQNPENAELIKTSIIRGKMLALISEITNHKRQESNYFISGLFSSIDVLLNEDMKAVVGKLPLGDDVCRTLLGEKTGMRKALEAVLEYEKGNWDDADRFLNGAGISREAFTALYLEAIKWQKTL